MIFAPLAEAAEARFLAVTKGSFWQQTGTGAPVQQTGNAHEFRALVDLARSNSVSAATVRLSSANTARSLVPSPWLWEYVERFPSRATLNNAHPNGSYRLVTQTVLDGWRTNSVTVSSDVYPIAPRIANFAEAQGIDPKSDFTLRWDSPNSGANGFVYVIIKSGETIVFQTPAWPQAPGALNGSASSVLIPRNTLVEGQLYQARITVWRKVMDDLNGYPGVAVWGAYTQTTDFPLRTAFSVTDVHWYGFAKNQHYRQTSVNPPVPAPNPSVEFLVFADSTGPANVKGGTIRTGAGASLGALANASGNWRFSQAFNSQAELDARFPAGTLDIQLDTLHNGVRSLPLNLPFANGPAAPQISNFNEASAIDGTKSFTLRWNTLAGATASDFLQVQIKKGGAVALRSGDHPFAPDALDGTSTSFSLPPHFLAPGESCEASIFFLKASATDSFTYPKALGLCGYARQTTVILRARGGNTTTPQLRNLRPLAGALEFDFSAEAGRQYIIQGSADFAQWTDLLITNAPGANFLLRLNRDPNRRHHFLRVAAN